MSKCMENPVTEDDREIYPLNLASIFPNEDLAYIDRRLSEDAGRLFRNDRLRIGLQTFSRGESATFSVKEVTAQRGDFPRLGDSDIITDHATFRIEFEVQLTRLSFLDWNVRLSSDLCLEAYTKRQ